MGVGEWIPDEPPVGKFHNQPSVVETIMIEYTSNGTFPIHKFEGVLDISQLLEYGVK